MGLFHISERGLLELTEKKEGQAVEEDQVTSPAITCWSVAWDSGDPKSQSQEQKCITTVQMPEYHTLSIEREGIVEPLIH